MKRITKLILASLAICSTFLAFAMAPVSQDYNCRTHMFFWDQHDQVTIGPCYCNGVQEGTITACDLQTSGNCDVWECDTEWIPCGPN